MFGKVNVNMNDREIRLECLKLATQISQNQPLIECLIKAQILEAYVDEGASSASDLLKKHYEKKIQVSAPALATGSGT